MSREPGGARAVAEAAPGRWPRFPWHAVAEAARILAGLSLLGVAAVAWVSAILPLAAAAIEVPAPAVPEPRVEFFPMLRDDRPVNITVTEAWRKVPLAVASEDLVRDPTLWNRMHFDDWDRVPEGLRRAGLERMIARFRPLTEGPQVWERMTAEDWDGVPQPVRAMAFIRIAEYWAEHYGIGVGHGIPPDEAGDTLAALIMVESWFEHRAVNVDVEGNHDVGLPQASDYFRARLDELHRRRWLDFGLEEGDYFNPWLAILAGAVWLDLMIDEARGDLELAVRAYHKGIDAARRGEAAEYAANVLRKKNRFVRNQGAPPTWDFLSRRLHRSVRVAKARA